MTTECEDLCPNSHLRVIIPEKFFSKQVDEIICSLEVSFFSQQSVLTKASCSKWPWQVVMECIGPTAWTVHLLKPPCLWLAGWPTCQQHTDQHQASNRAPFFGRLTEPPLPCKGWYFDLADTGPYS